MGRPKQPVLGRSKQAGLVRQGLIEQAVRARLARLCSQG